MEDSEKYRKKKLQFPYVVLAQYEHHTAADVIYNTTVYKNI